MNTHSVEELYQLAVQESSRIVINDTNTLGTLVGIAVFIFALMAFVRLTRLNVVAAVAITLFLAFGCSNVAKGDVNQKVDVVSHELANAAISQGVDQARRAQATELQYIHAAVVGYGAEQLKCERTVDYFDECARSTHWYTHQRINERKVPYQDCTTDSDGETSCTTKYRDEWDDEYTPYFEYVVRYWIEPDTRARYLYSSVYDMSYSDPSGHPHVFLHGDWRAPENPAEHTYGNRGLGWGWQYNDYIPEYWRRVRTAAQSGGDVVVANFVGAYFHWGLASESEQFRVYEGHYRNLQELVELPGPSGRSFSYTNAFNRPARMDTLLTGQDTDLALDFQPVSALGIDLDPNYLATLNTQAMSLQGHAGPNKETSIRWFILPESIVRQLDGEINATTALKAYLADTQVWGDFQLPKNQLIMLTVVTDDGTRIVNRGMETGMPFGNTLVAQRMRLSVPQGQTLFFTPENMFGNFAGHYNATNEQSVSYQYTDMRTAGGAIGLIYEETPGYTPLDPNSDECATAPAEHLGFIRYQMCTQQYRESTIRIDTNGALLILDGVRAGASAATQLGWAWLGIAAAVLGAAAIWYWSQSISR